jgi:hypothetical protein
LEIFQLCNSGLAAHDSAQFCFMHITYSNTRIVVFAIRQNSIIACSSMFARHNNRRPSVQTYNKAMPAVPRVTTRSNSIVSNININSAARTSTVPTSAAEAAWMSGNEAAIEEFIDGFMPGKEKEKKQTDCWLTRL